MTSIQQNCCVWRWLCTGGLPDGSAVKNVPANAGDPRDVGSISGLGRSARKGNGNPLQYSCLKTPMGEEPGRLQSKGSQRVRYNLGIERDST